MSKKRLIIFADLFEIILDFAFKFWIIAACVKFVIFGVALSFDGGEVGSTERPVERQTIRQS